MNEVYTDYEKKFDRVDTTSSSTIKKKFNRDVMFSSQSDDWSTPKDLYDKLNDEFHFDMDPCPLRSEIDGLDIDWRGTIFVNPPYSKIMDFIEKGIFEMEQGHAKKIVYLLPSRTDTKWFHWYIYNKCYAEIRFIQGRLKFGNSKNSAPFPSMIVIFNFKSEKCN